MDVKPASDGTFVVYDPAVPNRLLVPHRFREAERPLLTELLVMQEAPVPSREERRERISTSCSLKRPVLKRLAGGVGSQVIGLERGVLFTFPWQLRV
mmetsp:Transcript_53954/g.101277  ORF Transcript_53954/g.101277 Transcript_53954/m.101277 type:complete len:97 (-) Transcript_53954:98-388(-)